MSDSNHQLRTKKKKSNKKKNVNFSGGRSGYNRSSSPASSVVRFNREQRISAILEGINSHATVDSHTGRAKLSPELLTMTRSMVRDLFNSQEPVVRIRVAPITVSSVTGTLGGYSSVGWVSSGGAGASWAMLFDAYHFVNAKFVTYPAAHSVTDGIKRLYGGAIDQTDGNTVSGITELMGFTDFKVAPGVDANCTPTVWSYSASGTPDNSWKATSSSGITFCYFKYYAYAGIAGSVPIFYLHAEVTVRLREGIFDG